MDKNDRALLFTTGSCFSRAVRITLDELGLEYERLEEITTPSVEERAQYTPTLQVPTFWDGGVQLWESTLIVEYLLATYAVEQNVDQPLCDTIARTEEFWRDRLVLSTIQTLGNAAATISQMKSGGIALEDHGFLQRCGDRFPHLMGWLEDQIDGIGNGFIPGFLSVQDIFLVCHLDFVVNRPLGLDPKISDYPKLSELVDRLRQRESFKSNPILFWEPGVIGYGPDGVTPIYEKK